MGPENYAWRDPADIKYLVAHHSAVDVDSSSMALARYHVESLGWPGIGYHYVVHWDGRIDYVGDIATTRANVYGRNHEVAGICLTGDFMSREPGAVQLAATRQILGAILKRLPGREIVGHKDIALPASPTACPGDTWPGWKGAVTEKQG